MDEVSPKQNVVEVSPEQNVVEVSPKQNVTQNSMSNPADEEGIITSDEKAAIKSMNTMNKSESVPVYWVNLNKSKTRRKYFSEQLENLGMWNQRIRAVTPEDDVVKGATLAVIPAVQHTSVELSCVVSHLIAMHTAIYDEMSKDNQYALITEDDVSFEMDVDFLTLAELAPKDFGALQLMTSSSLVVKNYWNKYKEDLSIHKTNASTKHGITAFPDELIWKRRKVNSQYWSTQAYLINKKIAKSFIDRVVSYNSTTSLYSIKIVNPSEKLFPCSKPDRCFLPYRIVGDTYLYSGLEPSYLSRIPIFNGASVGENSTIHAKKSKNTAHIKSFSEIAVVLDDVRENPLLLPSYIRIKNNTNTNTNTNMNFIPSAL